MEIRPRYRDHDRDHERKRDRDRDRDRDQYEKIYISPGNEKGDECKRCPVEGLSVREVVAMFNKYMTGARLHSLHSRTIYYRPWMRERFHGPLRGPGIIPKCRCREAVLPTNQPTNPTQPNPTQPNPTQPSTTQPRHSQFIHPGITSVVPLKAGIKGLQQSAFRVISHESSSLTDDD
ncbi:hypothetical protein V1478_001771 [Vespula squamosa]|uniref:Uncharacterized protein n=1 Tax=Vespula squamosa TaxID=30214 RepID=A0ABD2BY63_VESSQ